MSYDKIKTNTALVDVMMHLSGNKQSLLRLIKVNTLSSLKAQHPIKFIQQLGLKACFGSNIHEISRSIGLISSLGSLYRMLLHETECCFINQSSVSETHIAA